MLAEFFNRTKIFANNQSSRVKFNRSIEEKCGDEAVGRVQIMNTSNACDVVAEVTPEHKIRDQTYIVSVSIDVLHQKIKTTSAKSTY